MSDHLQGQLRAVTHLGEGVREGYQEPPVALTLVGRQREDARQVVVLRAVLLLAEVPHEVRAVLVLLAQHVEEEVLDVEVKRLVVQEELGQQAQVLAVLLVPGNVDAIL